MNKVWCLTVFVFIIFASCSKNAEPVPVHPPKTLSREQWLYHEARILVRSFTLRDRAAQILMTGIDGKESFPPHLWNHYNGIVPGAILLFGYNIADTPEQIHEYILSCSSAFETMGGIVPPLVAIDHEGGMVFRLAGITAKIPSPKRVADTLSPELAENLYYNSGVQLHALGITMNLAPVAEILTPENESLLSSRAYGRDPDRVSQYVAAAIRGYSRAGVIPVIKHYPGNTKTDPHTGISTLNVSREILETDYLTAFRYAFKSGATAVLLSHVRVAVIDPDTPFCLSPEGVTGLLRNTDSFTGLVLTDDISMGALSHGRESSADIAIRALRAGCDMIMTSDTDIAGIVSGITDEAEKDDRFSRRLEDAVTTILMRKLELGIVLSSREKLARSRMGNPVGSTDVPFDTDTFTESGTQAMLLWEKRHE